MRLCLFPFFSRVCTLVSFFLRTRGVQYELRGMSVDESGDNLFRKSPRLSYTEAMEAKKARAQATKG